MRLAWDPSPSPDVAAYVVLYGFESGRYVFTNDAGNALQTVIHLPVPGETYFFVAKARSAAGLYSEPSNEVSFELRPEPSDPEVIRLAIDTTEGMPVRRAFQAPADGSGPSRLLFSAGPDHGRMTATPDELLYEPSANYTGPDNFRLIYGLARGGVVKVAVTVQVIGAEQAPVAFDQVVAVTPGRQVPVHVRAGAPASARLEYTLVSGPYHGALRGHLPEVVYFPKTDFEGIDEFSFVVGNGAQTSAVARVELDVLNRPPVLQDMSLEAVGGESVDIRLHAEDPESGLLKFFVVLQPRFGTLSGIAPEMVYQAAPGFFGTDRFLFVALDDHQQYKVGRVSIAVSPGAQAVPQVDVSWLEGGEVQLTWPSVAGMSAQVLSRPDLESGDWTPAGKILEATGPVTRWRTRIARESGPVFFRVKVFGPN